MDKAWISRKKMLLTIFNSLGSLTPWVGKQLHFCRIFLNKTLHFACRGRNRRWFYRANAYLSDVVEESIKWMGVLKGLHVPLSHLGVSCRLCDLHLATSPALREFSRQSPMIGYLWSRGTKAFKFISSISRKKDTMRMEKNATFEDICFI